jgi:hypothetical protein
MTKTNNRTTAIGASMIPVSKSVLFTKNLTTPTINVTSKPRGAPNQAKNTTPQPATSGAVNPSDIKNARNPPIKR